MKFAQNLNKPPEIGEIVFSRKTLNGIDTIKNHVEKISDKKYPSQYDQHIVDLFDNQRAIVSRATMGHLILRFRCTYVTIHEKNPGNKKFPVDE